MSRSGYSDDCDNLQLWRQAVDRAISGKRGQAVLREMLASLEALPQKRLISGGHVAHAETDRVPTEKHVGRPTVPKINRQTGRRSRYRSPSKG